MQAHLFASSHRTGRTASIIEVNRIAQIGKYRCLGQPRHTSSTLKRSGERPSEKSFCIPVCFPRRKCAILKESRALRTNTRIVQRKQKRMTKEHDLSRK